MDAEIELWAQAVARGLVGEAAPEELPFFDEIILAADQTEDHIDRFLGFGGESGAIILITGIMFEVGKQIAFFLWENGRDSAGDLVRDCSRTAQIALSKKFKEFMLGPATAEAPLRLDAREVDTLLTKLVESSGFQQLDTARSLKIQNWIRTKFGED